MSATEEPQTLKIRSAPASVTVILMPRDPLTHRLAVPPLPQGGKGQKSFVVSSQWSGPPPSRGKETHARRTKTKNSSSLSHLGERGDRKAVGEGVEYWERSA